MILKLRNKGLSAYHNILRINSLIQNISFYRCLIGLRMSSLNGWINPCVVNVARLNLWARRKHLNHKLQVMKKSSGWGPGLNIICVSNVMFILSFQDISILLNYFRQRLADVENGLMFLPRFVLHLGIEPAKL